MTPRRPKLQPDSSGVLAAALFALLLFAGCGPLPGQAGGAASSNDRGERKDKPGNTSSPAVQPRAGAADNLANQGGQTKPAGYTDARYHYSLNGPGAIQPRADGTAAFLGEDERLEVAVIEGAQAADPAALAQAEVASLSATAPNFRVLSRPAPVTLGGQSMIKFTYSWTARSDATGKQVTLTGVRYFIPKNAAMLAVLRYGDASNQFDSQEADGFASSFRWQ